MTAVESYRVLQDDRIEQIIATINEVIKNYDALEIDQIILPHIIQWFNDVYIDITSTCLIISSTTNINRLQETIDGIYEGVMPPLSAKSELKQFLKKDEYEQLVKTIEPKKREGTLRGEIDDSTDVVINFQTKRITQIKESGKKGTNPKITPVIEAVPKKIIVYDTMLLDQPRTFKIWWESNLSERVFVTSGESSGATLQEIETYLINAGFSHSPRLVGGALACTINTLIMEEYAEIKHDIDNPGFYYDMEHDKITPIKKDISEPTISEMIGCHEVLNDLTEFFDENLSTLSTVLKWGIMSEFGYAMKQAGKWMPWMYLKGSAGSGKTTLAQIMLYIWGEPTSDNNVGGSSFDTVARVGAKLSKSCDPIVVNEPASVFNRPSTREMVKVSVESTIARSKYQGTYYGGIPAFSCTLFTANQYIPEDDALLRRLYILSFSYSQRKTEHEKKMFEEKFHITTSAISPLRSLQALGRFCARYIITNPSVLLDDWKDTADDIINKFYEVLGMNTPEWLLEWEESENLDDFDDTQREDIRNFFIDAFNQARNKKVNVYDEDGNRKELTLDIDGVSTSEDFSTVNWGIVNNRLLKWALPHISRNDTKYVCLTQSLRKAISEYIDFCSDLKSIGELLGWEYCPVRLKNEKVMKVVKVKFEDFMEFLYPNIGLEEDT